jgi:fructokinase
MEHVWGGVEGGGTKFHCVLGREAPRAEKPEIVDEQVIPTTSPAETLAAVAEFFRRRQDERPLAGLGVACFGPVDLDPASPHYGFITTTPKPGWANCDVVGYLRSVLDVPVAWETDVNGALLGEQRWGAARGLRSAVYFTVGTGIGGGALVDGRPVHGLLHPEMGHLPITALAGAPSPSAQGPCPYHGGACLEGVASGPALAMRAGRTPAAIPADDPIWEDEARYLGYAAVVATLMLSPHRIIFGGGVTLNHPHLYPRIRTQFLSMLNGYLKSPTITDQIETYIVPPQLGHRAGVYGALALAMDAADRRL